MRCALGRVRMRGLGVVVLSLAGAGWAQTPVAAPAASTVSAPAQSVATAQAPVANAQAPGASVQAPNTNAQAAVKAKAGTDPVLERVLREWPEGVVTTVKRPGEWTYEEGVLLDGMIAEWRTTGDGRLFDYVKAAVDRSVGPDGVIDFGKGAPYPVKAHSLDDIEMGRSVLVMYRVTRQEKYYKAAKFLHDQMKEQPKNEAGGYWHKEIYPNQMWLDGAYMAEPFLEGYGRTFDHQEEIDEGSADGFAAARMGCVDEDALGGCEDGFEPGGVGARDGMVCDGAGGCVGEDAGERSAEGGD
jgi:hypothetical protein